jgi:hypothetical protein
MAQKNETRAKSKRKLGGRIPAYPQPAPEVIVDFVWDDELFFVCVENISDRPALRVTTAFDPKFRGGGGAINVSELPLFQNIEFLAPHKRIITFLDDCSSFFARHEPTRITAKIHFQDDQGKKYAKTIHHDLEIYRTICTVRRTQS